MKPKRNKHRYIHQSGRKVYLLTFLVFILGLSLGLVIILSVPFISHRDDLLRIAKERGQKFLSASNSYDFPSFGMDSYVYNENAQLVFSARETFLKVSVQSYLANACPSLFEKNEYYRIKILDWGEHDNNGNILCIIAGQTVTDAESGTRYCSFIIRDLKDLDVTLLTFIGLYAILFITAAVLLHGISRQHMELLNIQRDLISNVSHELKTPITSIKAIAEMINDGMYKGDEDLHRYSASILDETDRLENLVMEILELSKLQNNKMELKKEPCSAEDVLVPVIDRFKMMSSDTGITLDDSGMHADRIPVLNTDPTHIARVMGILLENAVKFTDIGGTISVGSQIQSNHTVFCVSDNGPGIDPDDLDKVFDRFYKSDLTHNSQGSGLGLAIASETLKGLGEKIWVESNLGEGSAFFFTVSHK